MSLPSSCRAAGLAAMLSLLWLGSSPAESPARSEPDRIDEAARLSTLFESGGSSIVVVNSDLEQPTRIIGDFAGDDAGGRFRRDAVPPQRARLVFLDEEPLIGNGHMAGLLLGEPAKLVDAISRSDWPDGGAILNGEARIDTDLIVPYVVKHGSRWSSQVVLQNATTDYRTMFDLSFVPSGAIDPLVPRYRLDITKGFRLLDLAGDPRWDFLPDGWTGSLHITSRGNLSAKVLHSLPGSQHAVADYDYLGADGTGRRLAAPLVARAWGDFALSYEIALTNPGPIPADIRVDFVGIEGSCAGQRYQQSGLSADINEVLVLRSGNGPLPEGCAAAAFITSSQPVTAIVTLANALGNQLAAYSVERVDASSIRLRAPFVRKQQGSDRGRSRVFVLNPNPVGAELRFKPTTLDGEPIACEACATRIAAEGGVLLDPADIEAFPEGITGGLDLTSDQPVSAVVLDLSRPGAGARDAALYRAFSPTTDRGRRPHFPLVIAGPAPRYGSSAPGQPDVSVTPVATNTPPPSPTPSPGPSPSPSATPSQGPTADPYPPPLPGTPLQLRAIGSVDVVGGMDQDCPGCDAVYDGEDRHHAAERAIEQMRFEIRDARGTPIATAISSAIDQEQQRALIDFPAPPITAPHRIVVAATPVGWAICPDLVDGQAVRAEDFRYRGRSVEYRFGFWSGCPAPIPTPPAPGLDFDRPAEGAVVAINKHQVSATSVWADFDPLDRIDGSIREIRDRIGFERIAEFNLLEPVREILRGRSHALRVEGDENLGVLGRLRWESGAAAMYDATEPGTELILPGLRYEPGNVVSALALQNPSLDEAQVSIAVYDGKAAAPSRSFMVRLPPRSGGSMRLDSHPSFAGLPAGFDGWARLLSDRSITAIGLTDIQDAIGLYALESVPAAALSAEAILPAVYVDSSVSLHGKPGPNTVRLDTRIQILNPGRSSIEIDLRFDGYDHFLDASHCRGESGNLPTVRLPPGAVRRIDRSEIPIPPGCVASALVSATGGPVLASAILTDPRRGQAAAYHAMPTDRGITNTALPFLRALPTNPRMSSALHLVNLGPGTGRFQLDFNAVDGRHLWLVSDLEDRTALRWWPEQTIEWLQTRSDLVTGSVHPHTDTSFGVLVLDLPLDGRSDISTHYADERHAESRQAMLPLIPIGDSLRDQGPIASPAIRPRPFLVLPAHEPNSIDSVLRVPIELLGNGLHLNGLEFELDYDARRWVWDPSDADADGRPDDAIVALPAGYALSVDHDPERREAELRIAIQSERPNPDPLPDGVFLTLVLDELQPDPERGWLRAAPEGSARAWDEDGSEIPAIIVGGWRAGPADVLLPFLINGW